MPTARTPDIRRELGMSRYWMRTDLRELDPTTDPIALACDPNHAKSRALLLRLGVKPTQYPSERWLPRAKLVEALRDLSPVDALALERAPGTDVGRWTVVYADTEYRVAIEAFAELGALVAAPEFHGCSLNRERCDDGGEHVWDAEVVLNEEANPDEEGPESGCSRCGLPFEFWIMVHGP